MIALHIITDNRNDDPRRYVPTIDFEIFTAPGVSDGVLYRTEATAPDTFRKLYGLGKGKRPGAAIRGTVRRKIAAALPLLWKSAAPVIFID